MTELTATELASRLGVTRRQALSLLGDQKIAGRQLSNGAWLVDSDSVTRFERIARRTSGRPLSVDASWALLWELSELTVNWLSASTHARLRRRIRESSIQEIALAVAGRTGERRFTAANLELASSDLISTGRAAASSLSHLGVELADDHRRISGYVRSGSMSKFAARNFMVENQSGDAVLLENTLPFDFQDEQMPVAVVAADLTRSTNTRERSTGLKALMVLRQRWLARY